MPKGHHLWGGGGDVITGWKMTWIAHFRPPELPEVHPLPLRIVRAPPQGW